MMHNDLLSPGLDRWIELPENRAATLAAQRVAQAVAARRASRGLNPLFLHGPSGAGKSALAATIIEQVIHQTPDRAIVSLSAGEIASPGQTTADSEDLAAARRADLLIVEDLQQLPERAVEALVGLVDAGLARGQQQVFTATAGPALLDHLPARLTSRLAVGLVVGLAPLGPDSRRAFLDACAQRRGLKLTGAVLDWLAEHLPGSGRVLEGAIARVKQLARMEGRPPGVDVVAECFRAEAEATRPTVERIAERVGDWFRVEPRQLQSRSRSRTALVPRQVGMYLARQLTSLSLDQIGAYFGGRDHSTVLHACRKVERALDEDVPLSQAVRQLHADLA